MIRWMSCEPSGGVTLDRLRPTRGHVAGSLLASVLATALTALSTTALAQTESAEVDPAAAALFREGRELVAQGDWDAGCEKFRESFARHASASTVLNLAQCAEHAGKTASAWALYQRALVVNRETRGERRRRELAEIARAGIAKLDPVLPRIFVAVPNAPEGVEVLESGRSLPLDSAVPLDPGKTELTASAPGFRVRKQSVELLPGRTTRVEIRLEPLPAADTAAPKPASAPKQDVGATTVKPGPAPEAPTWAWVVGGGGIVATGVAVFFVFDALDARSQLKDKCGPDFVCDEDPSFDPGPLNSRKNRSIGLAGGLGVAGAIAITASAVAILSVPSNSTGPSGSVWITPGSGGGSVRLRF